MTDDTPNFLRQLRIPRPSSGHLAALGETDRPIAVFSDFDGTIFLQDTGHVLFDKFGLGKEEREEVDQSIGKTRTFREASEIMWGSLNVTLERAQEELRSTLKIDPDFIAFFDYLQSKNVEFTVISAGLKPLLRCALDCFVGLERSAKINIIANNGTVSADGRWTPKWLHDSPLGIDKSLALRDWVAERSTGSGAVSKLVFIGDGVSDLAAAKQADILFARSELALERYCIEHMIPYIPYLRFKDVLHDVKYLLKGNRFHDPEAAAEYKQARIRELTGGIAPLSKKPTFGVGDDSDDSDEPVHRPHTPPGDPLRPVFLRKNSVGQLDTV